jgi:hypothetical protein
MYQSINLSEFRSAFHNMGRGDQFSYEGLEILFEGLENTDGEEMQLAELCWCIGEIEGSSTSPSAIRYSQRSTPD